MLLADFAELPDRETDLLVIAAIYHDAGFLHQKALNEPIGAELAAKACLQRWHSMGEIKTVRHILDTTLLMDDCAQVSNTDLSPYLLDADLRIWAGMFLGATEAVRSRLVLHLGFSPISFG